MTIKRCFSAGDLPALHQTDPIKALSLETTLPRNNTKKVAAASFNTTLQNQNPTKPSTKDDKLTTKLKKIETDEEKVKSHHLFEYNNEKYLLVHAHTEDKGAEYNCGYLQEDWQKVAAQMTALFNTLKAQNTLSCGTLNVTTGSWVQKNTDTTMPQTFDLTQGAYTKPLHDIQELFKPTKLSTHPLNYSASAPQPPDLSTPPPPQLPWYKRLKNKVGSLFTKNKTT